jgi:ferrous iron transport protein A
MTAPRTLADLQPGEATVVSGFLGSQSATQRLQEMGLTEGERIELVAVAPLGDPLEILLRGYHLSVRKSDARLVAVSD